MATILEQYRARQGAMHAQLETGNLSTEDLLVMQELNYRIGVLETFECLCLSAPITLDTIIMGIHFQLVEICVHFTIAERKFGMKTDVEGERKRETACRSFEQVVADGRKRFSNFSATSQEHYKNCISNYIRTILPVWMQYRNTYITL